MFAAGQMDGTNGGMSVIKCFNLPAKIHCRSPMLDFPNFLSVALGNVYLVAWWTANVLFRPRFRRLIRPRDCHDQSSLQPSSIPCGESCW
jgi:hypothetical protein